jgi:hypothetical protein
MVEPSAHIRAFKASDEKQVRFVIGKANLAALAVANIKSWYKKFFLMLKYSLKKTLLSQPIYIP